MCMQDKTALTRQCALDCLISLVSTGSATIQQVKVHEQTNYIATSTASITVLLSICPYIPLHHSNCSLLLNERVCYLMFCIAVVAHIV
jgi:hypothetical protein